MPKPSVQDRIKQVAAKSAPSMVPAAPTAPAPKVKEEIPTLSDLVKDRKDRLRLALLVQKYGELGVQKSEIEKEREAIGVGIKDAVGKLKVPKLASGDWAVNYFRSSRTSIKREKLITLGVSVDVVEAASETTVSYTLTVKRQEKEEGQE